MRAPEDVSVHHLVVDSGGFIKNAPLIDIGSKIYTLDDVIEEIRDKATRQRIKALPFELILREPTTESIKAVIDVSKKTGDYASLSLVDIKVIALTLDLHIENCGRESVVFDVKPQEPIWEDVNELRRKKNERLSAKNIDASGDAENEAVKELENLNLEDKEVDDKSHEEFTNCENEESDVVDLSENSPETDEDELSDTETSKGESDDSASEKESDEKHQSIGGRVRSGFGEWIDESNLQEVIGRMEAPTLPDHLKMKVACMTTDFALQNVLLHMKMNICSVDGMKISRLRTYILRCRICKNLTSVVSKLFCPKCGHNSLHKVSVSVDKNNVRRIHIDPERERVKRGYRYTMPKPKGGKHGNDILYMEDQHLPMNHMARIHENPVNAGPFALHDVASRAAMLGLRSFGRQLPKNPNVVRKKHPKKKKT
uniref:RNA-binding protein NOB1 n=1 Tax=Panagrolaimus sp. JU765 TaxID=591449 RepID=A0AC34QJ73_9BILA